MAPLCCREVCDRVLPNINDANFGKITHFFTEPPAKASALSPLQKQIAQSCVPVRLERGDTLYLPAGVVHRAASPDNATSLHCSVSVSRTHHHHSWATFLAAVLRSATPPLSTDKVCSSPTLSLSNGFVRSEAAEHWAVALTAGLSLLHSLRRGVGQGLQGAAADAGGVLLVRAADRGRRPSRRCRSLEPAAALDRSDARSAETVRLGASARLRGDGGAGPR